MFPVSFGWMLLTATVSGHAACVDDGCQGVQTNSLLQSGSATKKVTAAALEDSQTEAIKQERGVLTRRSHGLEDSQLEIEPGSFQKQANGECHKYPISTPAYNSGINTMGAHQDFAGAGSDSSGNACARNCHNCKAFDIDSTTGRCRVYFTNRAGYAYAAYAGQQCFNINPPTSAPTAQPTPDPTAEPTASPTAEPTASPTADPTEEPTEAPTTSAPTKAEDFHAIKVAEHSGYQAQFTSDCEPCIIAEKYAVDNATECTQKHKDAEQNAVSLGEAESALDVCETQKLAAEAEVASAKSTVSSTVTEVSTAIAGDDAQKAKEGADKLCTALIDAWITKIDNVAPCDEASSKVAQSKAAYESSSAAAKECDSRAQTAKDEAAVACANLVNADDPSL